MSSPLVSYLLAWTVGQLQSAISIDDLFAKEATDIDASC